MACTYCKDITVCAICGKGYAEAVQASKTEGPLLVQRFEFALTRLVEIYDDVYADAEDRGDAKRELNEAREALLAAPASPTA